MADNETHQTAKRLFEDEGMSKAAIARQLNVSPQSVGKWAKDDGWFPEPNARNWRRSDHTCSRLVAISRS